jgi:hypothetical protein
MVMKIDLGVRCGPLAPRGEASRMVMPFQQAAIWLRRIGRDKGRDGRPGAKVKLKIVKAAFSA